MEGATTEPVEPSVAADADDYARPSGGAGRKGPVRVMIVGGGCAGLAAAWQLSKLPGYEIHVYERSWRLGGKGSSVRDDKGRILEHGLHVWLGFYENAFRMMRECYAEVERTACGPQASEAGRRLVHRSMDDAFFPEPHIGVAGRDARNEWIVWSGLLPPAKGLPGEPLDEASNPFSLRSYVLRCFDLVRALMVSVIGPPADDATAGVRPGGRSSLDEALDLDFSYDPARSPAVFIEGVARLLRNGALTTAAGLLQAVTMIETTIQRLNYAPQVSDSILRLMEAVAAQMRKQLREFVGIDPALRRKTEIIDIVMTIAVGLYRDRVLLDAKGLDAINHIDYRQWLLQHGATRTSVESPFMQGIYDLVFAYRDGDREQPALAAGVALRGALRMFFTYRGSMFWRMRSGMGDAVFAPLYRMMSKRRRVPLPKGNHRPASPVTFHFLHTLAAIELDLPAKRGGTRLVRRLVFETSVAPERADAVALDGNGCWPETAEACFGAPTKPRQVVREIVEHFDAVVLATGVDDFTRILRTTPFLDDTTSAVARKWRRMSAEVRTVATKAAQVWLSKDLKQLGWHRGPGVITALGLAFETWADMSHTIPVEERARPPGDAGRVPRSVAYFCGVLPQSLVDEYGEDCEAQVRRDLDGLLAEGMRHAWPRASRNGDARRLELHRHVQANTKGSDRYTLSLPGTLDDRISPLDRTFANMTIAGDWTACGLDAGCVEAAVMSGLLAAHALSGTPELSSIVGYDHP